MINYTIFYHRHLASLSTCSQILTLGGKRLDFVHAYHFLPNTAVNAWWMPKKSRVFDLNFVN